MILGWMNHHTGPLDPGEESGPNFGVSQWWNQSCMLFSQLWRMALQCPKTTCSSVKNAHAGLSVSHSLLNLWSCDHLPVTGESLWRISSWCILWKSLLWQHLRINWHLRRAAVMIIDWRSQQKGHWPSFSSKQLCQKAPIPNTAPSISLSKVDLFHWLSLVYIIYSFILSSISANVVWLSSVWRESPLIGIWMLISFHLGEKKLNASLSISLIICGGFWLLFLPWKWLSLVNCPEWYIIVNHSKTFFMEQNSFSKQKLLSCHEKYNVE